LVIQTEKRTIAVYPGSFDPVTFGHIDIIERAARQFDHVIVAVLNNTSKKPMFTLDERIVLLTQVTDKMKNVSIDHFRDLLVRFMASRKAQVIIRGIRSVTDFEYELQLASMNRSLSPSVETMFIPTSPQFSYLSSSLVREIAQFGGDVSRFVPHEVEIALQEKYALNPSKPPMH
jgi:pantetheine-phosphate adenylyltransferase